MNPTLCNVNDLKFIEMISSRVDQKGKEFAFIEWVPTSRNDNDVVSQIEQIKLCQKKNIPIIVFDRHSSMTPDEIIYIHKNTTAKLFEPVVVPRQGFEFMPYWIHFKEYKLSDFSEDRKFQTGYKGDNFTKDTEAIILSVIKDKITVGIDTKLSQDKYDVLRSIVCIGKFEHKDFSTIIVSGNKSEYTRGVIPDIREAMYNGTVPCLHHNHKWLHSIFKNFVVYSSSDVRWMAKLYKNCGIGFIEDMQRNILEYLPEMESNNFIDNLLEIAEKL